MVLEFRIFYSNILSATIIWRKRLIVILLHQNFVINRSLNKLFPPEIGMLVCKDLHWLAVWRILARSLYLSYLLILVLKSFMTDGGNFSKYCVSITVSMSELWTLLNAEVPRWLKFMLAVSPCCWAGLGQGGEQLQSSEWHRDTTERGLLYWGLQIFCGENSHMADSNHAKWFAGSTDINVPVSFFFNVSYHRK